MNRRGRNTTGRKNPLLVREIILPKKSDNDQGTSRSFGPNYIEEVTDACGSNAELSFVKIGEREVKQIMGLVKIEKKPLENYYKGSVEESKKKKGHKERSKKVKSQRSIPMSELFCDGSCSSSVSISSSPHKSENLILQEEEKLLHMEIEKYERRRMKAVERNHIRQSLAEKAYIEQLENLTETWFGKRQRKGRLKQDRKSSQGENSKTEQEPRASVGISGDKETVKGCRPLQILTLEDDLMDDFFEKLVFVDEESAESECGQNSRRN